MTVLILAEKPDQAKKYAQALGKAYWKDGCWKVKTSNQEELVIVSSMGHIVQMDNPVKRNENWQLNNLPIFPKEFTYQVNPTHKKRFLVIKREAEKATSIIIGTDPGREGEAIAYRILHLIPNSLSKVTHRLWCRSLSKKGIQQSFSTLLPAHQTRPLYHEATARHLSDWLVGYNFSPFVTLKMKQNGLLETMEKALSVGRVQTPIVQLVVDNDQKISSFVPTSYYKSKLIDKMNDVVFTYGENFLTKQAAEEFNYLLSDEAIIYDVLTETTTKESPELFDLSDLQAYMSRQYKWSADYTLAIAQMLYTKELISYPRTDYKTIGQFEFAYLNRDGFCEQLAIEVDLVGFEKVKGTVSNRFVDDEATGDHHAIIPTETFPNQTDNSFSEDEIILYKEVVKRTLLMFEGDYVVQKTTVSIDNNGFHFLADSSYLVSIGWRKFVSTKKKYSLFPREYVVGKKLIVDKELVSGETSCPKRITESDLLSTILKTYHLGTSATRAGILKTIYDRGYLLRHPKNGKLYPLERGRKLISFLKQFDMMYTNVHTTKIWEDTLTRIGRGEVSETEFIEQVKLAIAKQMEAVLRQEEIKNSSTFSSGQEEKESF